MREILCFYDKQQPTVSRLPFHVNAMLNLFDVLPQLPQARLHWYDARVEIPGLIVMVQPSGIMYFAYV